MPLEPKRRWLTLDGDTYRVTWGGRAWLLRATPRARHPWLLYSPDESGGVRVKQEIGMPGLRQAQGMAELWLDLSSRFPSGSDSKS